jgi:type IV secretion system protein VirD4
MAGYGLKSFLIAQSLNQIEKAYGPNNSILDNCHVRVSFATNDERTAKRVSALGTATEMKAMKNYAGHRLSPWLGHLMVSRSETARQLLTPGEIMQLPPTDEIVMVAGTPPIRRRRRATMRMPASRNASCRRRGWRGRRRSADDWSTLPIPARPDMAEARADDERRDDEDPPIRASASARTQPGEPIEKKAPIDNEFEIDLPDDTEDAAARNSG